MKSERIHLYLQWIIDGIEKIESYTKGKDLFTLEGFLYDACLMQMIHIGELMNKIKKIDKVFTLGDIDIQRVIDFRNFIAHDYLQVNMRIFVRIIEKNIPELKDTIENYLKN